VVGIDTSSLQGEVHRCEERPKLDNHPSQIKLLEAVASDEFSLSHIYTLDRSVYDAMLFVGLPVQGGNLASIYLIALLLLAILVQTCFIGVVRMAFVTSSFNEEAIAGLRLWRLNTAHNPLEVDQLNEVSLASRVCNPAVHTSLEKSTAQAQYVSDLLLYLDHDIGFYFSIGLHSLQARFNPV